MAAQQGVSRDRSPPATYGGWSRDRSGRLVGVGRWELVVAVVGLVAAAVAFWVTLNAHFLQYPAWLAVQKTDWILGPIGVGLYWHHRRPGSRFGPLLIALGLVGVPYILQSSTVPVLFGFGVMWEGAIWLMTEVVILAFPSGRLEGRGTRAILAFTVAAILIYYPLVALTVPHSSPEFSISGCRAVCPANGLAIWSAPSWVPLRVTDFGAVAAVAVSLATGCLLVRRWVTGTPPQRRALAIGTPVALLFLLTQAVYNGLQLLELHGAVAAPGQVSSAVLWTIAGTRALIWYGFLLALVAAELFAGRVLRRLVRASLGRPSLSELEGMLRGPLGDPRLRLGFWRPTTSDWADAQGSPLTPPGAGQALINVDRDGRPAVAVVHDAQLSEDPELLQVAGAVALLALENAELDAAWRQSLQELSESRARIVRTSQSERRKLERDLHDGAQQRLTAAMVWTSLAEEQAGDNPPLRATIRKSGDELEQAMGELRQLSHGIYPRALARSGLAEAIRARTDGLRDRVTIAELSELRFPPEVEIALYYCCLEAVQNAVKHAAPDARISIRVFVTGHELHLAVRDTGPGFHVADDGDGVGIQNMRDRIGTVGGQLEIISDPRTGTLVAASVPVNDPLSTDRRRPAISDTHQTAST